MGVSAIHHRVCIGLYNSYKIKYRGMSRPSGSTKRFVYHTAAAACIVLYFYILLFLMMIVLDISPSTHGNYNMENTFPTVSSAFYPSLITRHFLNILFLSIIGMSMNFIIIRCKNSNRPVFKLISKYNSTYSMFSKFSHAITIWIVSINLLLIVLTNPAIVNPGPSQNVSKISLLYQNVRGLIPFTELGVPSPYDKHHKTYRVTVIYIF